MVAHRVLHHLMVERLMIVLVIVLHLMVMVACNLMVMVILSYLMVMVASHLMAIVIALYLMIMVACNLMVMVIALYLMMMMACHLMVMVAYHLMEVWYLMDAKDSFFLVWLKALKEHHNYLMHEYLSHRVKKDHLYGL
jgi:hypothetical protein